jgi:hypothetical protein
MYALSQLSRCHSTCQLLAVSGLVLHLPFELCALLLPASLEIMHHHAPRHALALCTRDSAPATSADPIAWPALGSRVVHWSASAVHWMPLTRLLCDPFTRLTRAQHGETLTSSTCCNVCTMQRDDMRVVRVVQPPTLTMHVRCCCCCCSCCCVCTPTRPAGETDRGLVRVHRRAQHWRDSGDRVDGRARDWSRSVSFSCPCDTACTCVEV